MRDGIVRPVLALFQRRRLVSYSLAAPLLFVLYSYSVFLLRSFPFGPEYIGVERDVTVSHASLVSKSIAATVRIPRASSSRRARRECPAKVGKASRSETGLRVSAIDDDEGGALDGGCVP